MINKIFKLKLILFLLSFSIHFIYAGIAETDPKVQALIEKNKLQEAAWISSELGDEEYTQELEQRIKGILKSKSYKYRPFRRMGVSHPYLLQYDAGIRGIMKADQWDWLQPTSWMFGEEIKSNANAEVATSRLDRLFRFNIVPTTVMVKWWGLSYSIQYFVQDVFTGNEQFGKLSDSIEKKLEQQFGKKRRKKWIIEQTSNSQLEKLISLKTYNLITNEYDQEIPIEELRKLLTPAEYNFYTKEKRDYWILEPTNGIVKLISDFIFENMDIHTRNWLYWEEETRLITIDCGLSCGSNGVRQYGRPTSWLRAFDPQTCKLSVYQQPGLKVEVKNLPERIKTRIIHTSNQTIYDELKDLTNIDQADIVHRVSLIRDCLVR